MTQKAEVNENIEISYFKKDHKGIIVDKKRVKTTNLSVLFLSFACLLFLILGGWTSHFESEITKKAIRTSIYSGSVAMILIILWVLFNSKKTTKIYQGNFSDLTHIFCLLGLSLKLRTEREVHYKFQSESLILPGKIFLVRDHGSFCEISGLNRDLEALAELISLESNQQRVYI